MKIIYNYVIYYKWYSIIYNMKIIYDNTYENVDLHKFSCDKNSLIKMIYM